MGRCPSAREQCSRRCYQDNTTSAGRADMGYNISSYEDTDTRYSTLEAVEELIREPKNRNLYLLLDLVINYTNKQHGKVPREHEQQDESHARMVFLKAAQTDQRRRNIRTTQQSEPDPRRGQLGMAIRSHHGRILPHAIHSGVARPQLGESRSASSHVGPDEILDGPRSHGLPTRCHQPYLQTGLAIATSAFLWGSTVLCPSDRLSTVALGGLGGVDLFLAGFADIPSLWLSWSRRSCRSSLLSCQALGVRCRARPGRNLGSTGGCRTKPESGPLLRRARRHRIVRLRQSVSAADTWL